MNRDVLHQCAHRAAVAETDDEVALPVTGNGPIGDLGGPLGDHHHVGDLSAPMLPTLALAPGPTRSQIMAQLALQFAPARDEERLIDRLVAHSHLRVVRIVQR